MENKINKPKHIIIHHTSVKSNKKQLDAVDRYHHSLGFPKSTLPPYYNVGYTWFIEKDGQTIRTKLDREEGAHTLGGWNTKSIGICLAGNFDIEYPSDAQIASLRRLTDRYGYKILLHREAQKNRHCPGHNFTRVYVDAEIGTGIEDDVKCEAIKKELAEQKTLVQQLIAFIVNKLR